MPERINFIFEIEKSIRSNYKKIREAIRKAMEAEPAKKTEPNWKEMREELDLNMRWAEAGKIAAENSKKALEDAIAKNNTWK